jgi:flagellar hook-associated protein 1 FlgK
MSGLFSALETASTALQVFTQALGASQTNIANASTAGYAALRASILPIDLSGDGSAVGDFVSLTSTGSSVADALVQTASTQAANSQTTVDQLTPVNQLFDITGSSGILAAFQGFSTAFANLSVTPNDPALGAQALAAAGSVASSFQSAADSLASQSQQVASSIQATAQQINTLAGQIRQLNAGTVGQAQFSPGIDATRRSDLDQLSSLIDITTTRNSDGTVSVLAGGEIPLVVGTQSYTISVDPTQPAGSQVTSSDGGYSPAAFSGQLGALLNSYGVVGQLLGPVGSAGSLNMLAAGFATQVNSLLTAGVNASGAAGVPIFTFDPANAAQTLAVDPAVTATQLGLGTAAVSTNGVANQLAALSSSTNAADEIDGLSPEGFFSSIAASIGQQLSDAGTASTADQTSLTAAQTARQQQSGVSLDQEAVNITTYQRSYEANAQLVGILDQLTSDEVHMIDGAAL